LARVLAEQARMVYAVPSEAGSFVELTSIVFAGGFTELLIVWLNGGLKMDREELIAATADLVAATGQSASTIAARYVAARSSSDSRSGRAGTGTGG
jgi:hypothetical protein